MMRRNGLKQNKGTTLIETLAAFTVLAAILAILFHIVDFSSRLRTQAVDSARLNQMFLREMYLNEPDPEFVSYVNYYSSVPAAEVSASVNQCRFWLVLDVEEGKTDLQKYTDYGNDYDKAKNNDYFYLYNTAATAYTCIDPLINEEQLPRPGALTFHYQAPTPAPAPGN